MGPFLADRVPTRTAYWLFGVAVAASAVSLATLERPEPARSAPAIWKKHPGCKQRVQRKPPVDTRPRLMIGPMLEAGTYRDVMRDTVKATLAKSGTWSLALVDKPPARGYFVDGTVDELEVERAGDTSYVRCELKLWVRSGRTTVALLSGAARVATTTSQRDIALSRQACVTTVAEDLAARRLSAVVFE